MKKYLLIISLLITTHAFALEKGVVTNYTNYIGIGDYSVSVKDKKVARVMNYNCNNSQCARYVHADNIDFDTTKLYVSYNKFAFTEDFPFDIESFKVIEKGNYQYYTRKSPIFIDKNNAYNGFSTRDKICSLKGFKHFKGHFFIQDNQLAYLDNYGLSVLNDVKKIDLPSFKIIFKNMVYDKNAVYYVHNKHFIKIKELDPKNLTIKITDDYFIVNNIVYSTNQQFHEPIKVLSLDPKKIQKVDLYKLKGTMLLFDGNNIYSKGSREKCGLYKQSLFCFLKDFTSFKSLRESLSGQFQYDKKNKVIYFDSEVSDKKFIHTDGSLYKTKNGYYFGSERYSTRINQVKIWNNNTKQYEDLDLEKYHYFNGNHFWYKGVLYDNHSRVSDENFSIENARELKTLNYSYMLNNEKFIGGIHTDGLNLDSIKVLTLKNGTPSNYLVGDNFLIHYSTVIRNVSVDQIQVLAPNIVKTDNFIIIKGEKYEAKNFPEIVILD